ncbi:hypothetical protein HSR122_1095 [Halapricum desulfuricans]|uniref:Uncharacterized protein n=1 Tax=Halapricum desulfuricans TaxID=2841257 RepID=A0A897NDM5_9EURY|nr:hypothetical protein HSR122_1095 [Halapricum desulfuricans]
MGVHSLPPLVDLGARLAHRRDVAGAVVNPLRSRNRTRDTGYPSESSSGSITP